MIADHGHRKDQDHFVKLICWAGFDEDGNWTIKYHCLDVDISGHSAKEAAEAVQKSIKIFIEVLQDIVGEAVTVELADLCCDSGGGAAAHRLHPALVEINVMKEVSNYLGCDMHAWNKPLEVACVETFGKQGIGCRTPFQMLWLFVQFLKTMRKKVSKKKLDELWGEAVQELRTNSSWQTQVREVGKQSFDEFMDKLAELEESEDATDLDKAVKLTSEAPSNVADPVLSRWGSVMKSVEVVLDSYPVIFVLVRIVKHSEARTSSGSSRSYLFTICCALLSLMNTKEIPDNSDDTMSWEDWLTSVDCGGADAESDAELTDNPDLTDDIVVGDSTVIYTALSFLHGFNKTFYEGMLQLFILFNNLTFVCFKISSTS